MSDRVPEMGRLNTSVAARSLSATFAGLATAGCDDRTHERGREPDDRASLYEVATADFVLGVGLDEVKLNRPRFAPSAIE